MSLINIFAKLKPFCLRGTGMFNPLPTSKIDEHLSVIKQYDVNIWLYTKNKTTIAIDTGYKNYAKLETELAKLEIDNNKIHSVFLTHADIDHAGGLISQQRFAPNAKVYLHKYEEDMLIGKERRFDFKIISLKNPIKYIDEYSLFNDKDIFDMNGIEIKCFHTKGHTKGHTAFLVDRKYLFTGDSIAINENGGYCFFNFYNMDTKQSIQSLIKLQNEVIELIEAKPKYVCSSHNGMCEFDKAFLNIDTIAKASKIKPFDKTAPLDIFKQ